MIAGHIVKVNLKHCSQSLEEVGDKLRTPVASDVLWNSVFQEDVEDKQPYQFWRVDIVVTWNEDCLLGVSTDNDKNGGVAGQRGKLFNEVHLD
jgi:hypothetical protein